MKKHELRHIAIIPDGNRRWASSRKLPLAEGYRRGVGKVKDVATWCMERDIRALTLFGFSKENWKRSSLEVKVVMEVIGRTLRNYIPILDKKGARFSIIGDRSSLPPSLLRSVEQGEKRTSKNKKFHLRVALSYGGKWEIADAASHLMKEGKSALKEDQIQEMLEERLSFGNDPDLIIRTGGEKRLSNFLLWQGAYSELYFTDTLWPDFSEQDFETAVKEYASRERRFGK